MTASANDPGLLIAAAEHGPSMHGGAALVLVVLALAGALFYLLHSRRKGRSRDRGPEA